MGPHTTESEFATVEAALAALRAGGLVVVTDDGDPENAGDLIAAGAGITAETVNFMITAGKGMLCASVEDGAALRLGLSEMVPRNREAHRTHARMMVDATHGIAAGVSAADRARTIRVLADPTSGAEDLVRPGHITPLIARPGGVLQRAGHTEAAVDLAKLAGLSPAGALIAILNEAGTPMRLVELRAFSLLHGLPLISMAALIAYRRRHEQLIKLVQVIPQETRHGEFSLHLFRSTMDDQEHLALVMGAVDGESPVLTRVHSECLTGDVFGSQRCDCGWQLDCALERIGAEGRGILLYMRQEGRGIGLAAKIHAYKLQEEGYDTVEANLQLGYAPDLRDYGMGAQMLHALGARKLRLMTNNPRKIVGLEGYGLEVTDQVAIQPAPTNHNRHYLETKRTRMGHIL